MSLIKDPAPLTAEDHRDVTQMFRQRANRHMHLDWRSFEQWLTEPTMLSRVLRREEGNGGVRAMVGATVHHHPSGAAESPAAWVRFILPTRDLKDPAFDEMWLALKNDLQEAGVKQVACLVLQPWTEGVIRRWGFEEFNAIVTLRRVRGPMPPFPENGVTLRDGSTREMDAVVQVDAAAFGPLWAYSRQTLLLAQKESSSFTVLERAGEIIGYQMSTDHYNSGHLARLAVRPGVQGQGYGGLLMGAMMRYFAQRRIGLLTVNTQADNMRSRRLYTRYGFQRTGPDVPVFRLWL